MDFKRENKFADNYRDNFQRKRAAEMVAPFDFIQCQQL